MNNTMQKEGSRGCDHYGTAVEAIGQERELVARLRELVLPSPAALPRGDAWSELVAELFDCISECSSKALSGLRRVAAAEAAGGGGERRGKRGRGKVKYAGEEDACKPQGGKRRKKQETTTLVTPTPDYDGYQWRKYGQKQIEGTKYPRSYYRCTNSADQDCPAKRMVQRNDDDYDSDETNEPPKYTVVYIAHHTCKPDVDSVAPVIIETAPCKNIHVESPPVSDITWTNQCEHHGSYDRPAVTGDHRSPTPASLAPEEIDLTCPDGWIDELLVDQPTYY